MTVYNILHSIQNMLTLIHEKNTRNKFRKIKIYIDTRKYIHGKIKKFIGTRKYIHEKIKQTLLIHENTYTIIIAANTRIHDTRNFMYV